MLVRDTRQTDRQFLAVLTRSWQAGKIKCLPPRTAAATTSVEIIIVIMNVYMVPATSQALRKALDTLLRSVLTEGGSEVAVINP